MYGRSKVMVLFCVSLLITYYSNNINCSSSNGSNSSRSSSIRREFAPKCFVRSLAVVLIEKRAIGRDNSSNSILPFWQYIKMACDINY